MTSAVGVRPFDPCPTITGFKDLQNRLHATRFPDEDELSRDWTAGTALPYLKAFAAYWAERLDDGSFLDDLEAEPHFITDITGSAVHFLHFRSSSERATPLLAIHGWPSSFMEYVSFGKALADRRGASPFHVVVPSLPGFVFSAAPNDLDGYAASRIAAAFATLMSRLGYSRFLVTGGDVGARVASWLGALFSEQVIGLHVSSNALEASDRVPDRDGVTRDLRSEELAWIARRNAWAEQEGAYLHLHQTKPMTLAPSLADSPIALASWVTEKWQSWSTTEITLPSRMEHLARLCTLYFLTNSGPRSILPYYAYERAGGARAGAEKIDVPVAFYVSEGEIGGIPPESLAERRYDLRQWTELRAGGHFPALDVPDQFLQDVQRFGARLCAQPP
jgi:pimeloyl-ACP methyl ester carboxylesterase